jgi:polyisoprenoid-binding protein YceI
MKTVFFLIPGLLATPFLFAQYKPIDQGSSVTFVIHNFGFAVDGTFTGLQGTINFDGQQPDRAGFDVSIDASTVNTANSLRDDHLRGESYFDVKNYPRIRLVSSRITAKSPGVYTFTGELIIKDKTRPVSFPFTIAPSGGSMIFKGSFTINRRDFDVGGASTISSELTVSLTVMTTK